MKDPESVQRLIRLKRYENPGEEYVEQFLVQFRERQRSELLSRSARGIFLERLSLWYNETLGPRWLLPVGAAATVAIGTGFYLARPAKEAGASPAALASKPQGDQEPAAEVAPVGDEIITLRIPKAGVRVPDLDGNPPGAKGPVLRAGVRGSLREL